MSTVENGAAGASSTSAASRYNINLSNLFVVFFMFLYRLRMNTNKPYDAIILLIFNNIVIYFIAFGIKIYRKMPKILTQTWPLSEQLKRIFVS
jgi:magnesium-transporting ATPase (P-type)